MEPSTDRAHTPPERCPGREVLAELALGRLPANTIDTIGPHVEACPTCQATLETLDGVEDSVVRDLKTDASLFPVDPALAEHIQVAEAISEQVWGHAVEAAPAASCDVQPSGRLGQYELLEPIGHGGMGSVFKALHTRLKRQVAIKLLPAERTRDPRAVSRFFREMEAVGRLDHPNLVRAHDAGEVDGQHFLVMELVDGVNLSQVVRRTGPLGIADACEVTRQAALGLQHAHEHGLVHRDIKPSNLMLTAGGQIKVLDLGLARLVSDPEGPGEMTDTGQVMGTGDFMAPEQGQDVRQADARSDIYSLGCTLYYLLAGRAPFSSPEHNTLMRKIMAHVHEPVSPIVHLRPDVPRELAGVLDRMLDKEPAKRFQTAAEVASALRPWAEGANLQRVVAGAMAGIADAPQLDAPADAPRSPAQVTGTAPKSNAGMGTKTTGWLLLLAMLSFAGLAGVMLMRLKTDRGELVISSPSPDVKIEVNQQDKTLNMLTGVKEYRLDLGAGKYTLAIQENAGAYDLSADHVEIRRGTSFSVTIHNRRSPKAATTQTATPLNPFTLVQRPAALPGLHSWTMETHGGRAAIASMAFSPDGQYLAAGDEVGCVRIYRRATWELVRLIVQPDRVYGLAWSPDGKGLAVATGRLRIWEPLTGQPAWDAQWDAGDPATAVAWAEAGSLASGHQGGLIRLWSPIKRAIAGVLAGHQAAVKALAFTQDGSRLASGCQEGTVRVWSIAKKMVERVIKPEEPDAVRRLAWSPNGKSLACLHEWRATLALHRESEGWDPRIVNCTAKLVNDLAWSTDGSRLATASHDEVLIWDGDTLNEVHRQPHSMGSAVAWCPDNRTLVCGLTDGGLALVHEGIPTKRPLRAASICLPTAVAWSPDSRRLLVGCVDGGCRIWDVAQARHVLAFQPQRLPVTNVAWSGRGDLVAVSSEGLVKILGAGTGELRGEVQFKTNAMDVAFSPIEPLVAVIESAGTCHVWDCTRKHEVFRVEVTKDHVGSAVAWSPHGRWLACAAWDDPLRLIDVAAKRIARSWPSGHGVVHRLAWQPDNALVSYRLARAVHQQLHFWNPLTRQLLRSSEERFGEYSTRAGVRDSVDYREGRFCTRSPDGSRLAALLGSAIAIQDYKTRETQVFLCGLGENQAVAVFPDGSVRDKFPSTEVPVFVVQHDDGRQENATPTEFASRYGLRNQPYTKERSGK